MARKLSYILLLSLLMAVCVNAKSNDTNVLAGIICREGHGESYKTKLMIGSVVLNRVKSKQFPNTISKVVYQRNQFAKPKLKPCKECCKAADELLKHGSILPSDVLYFHAKSLKRNWVTSRGHYLTRDNTVFRRAHR